jgi:Tfp pilus assembly protein PilN
MKNRHQDSQTYEQLNSDSSPTVQIFIKLRVQNPWENLNLKTWTTNLENTGRDF